DKAFYIVQQQASGKSLFDLVQSGWRTTEAEVKDIAQQVLVILTYLHLEIKILCNGKTIQNTKVKKPL
ncbi:MAG: hypothetical protein AAF298_20695, partial [Cyanobacteria bacterium P01_A01_bin.40]